MKTILKNLITAIALIATLAIFSTMDFNDQVLQEKNYCEMLERGEIPNFKEINCNRERVNKMAFFTHKGVTLDINGATRDLEICGDYTSPQTQTHVQEGISEEWDIQECYLVDGDKTIDFSQLLDVEEYRNEFIKQLKEAANNE